VLGAAAAQVRAVRERLQQLGPAIPSRVLHAIRASILAREDIAVALLRDIDADTRPFTASPHFLASALPTSLLPLAGSLDYQGCCRGASGGVGRG